MIFFLLVSILCFNSGGGTHYHYVKQDYSQKHNGHIVLHLNHHTSKLTVKRIRWCGSKTHVVTSCSEPDLYHVTLSLSGEGVEIKDGVIEIDPSLIGGWDYTTHSQIVVEAEFENQKLFQTFAFEKNDNKKVEVARPQDLEAASSQGVPSSDAPQEVPPSSDAPQEVPPSSDAPQEVPPSSDAPQRSPSSPQGSSSPWQGMGSLLGLGLFALLSLGYIAHKKRQVSKALDIGDFELIPPSHDVVEDDDEQMQLLMSMGQGANAVFIKNL